MRILMIGATGMLGRPVARQLVEAGFQVRAMVRDMDRARALLPQACERVRGDLRETDSVRRALEGVDAAYLNLSEPIKEGRWNPELEGSKLIASLAKTAGLSRIARISAMGVEEGAGEWWVARDKAEADRAFIDSGVPYTIFRPDWFCESLALMRVGPLYVQPMTPRLPLHWIAGDDYGRQVVAALHTEKAANRIYIVQGPEGVTMQDAARRYRRAMGWRTITVPLPMSVLRVCGRFVPMARFLHDLLELTYTHTIGLRAEATWTDLGRPAMTIEDHAASRRKRE